MASPDPTYPAYPIACSLAFVMLVLLLLTSFVRQSWNLGVALLCIWSCLDNLISAVNAIAWSDNADLKSYVWCDIASRMTIATVVGANITPLLITRRLYLITRLRSVSPPSKKARRWNLATEWILGFVWPLVIAGPVYLVIESSRFQVIEVLGCTDALEASILMFVVVQTTSVLPPIISVLFYYPKVALTFYRQSQDVNRFLRSNNSLSRTNYFRILAIASIDILLTLPIGLVALGINLRVVDWGSVPFYSGWEATHSQWTPQTVTFAEYISGGTYGVVNAYWSLWSSPVEAFVIFSLFGLTADARASYWRVICAIGGWFGWKPSPRASDAELGAIEFGERPVGEISLGSGIRTPSFVNVEPPQAEPDAQREADGVPGEPISDADEIEETSRSSGTVGEAQDRQVHNAETASIDVATLPVEIAGSVV